MTTPSVAIAGYSAGMDDERRGALGPIWYPAPLSAAETKVRFGSAFYGRAAKGAPWAASNHGFPAVLLVHGLRGSPVDLSWLGERLARAGYAAVAVEMADCSYRSYHPQRAPQVWKRAEQIRAAFDALEHESAWAAKLNLNRLAVVGHSAGASAALAAAGAYVDETRFLRRYPNSGPVPAPADADPRIRAVVMLAAGTGEAFADAGMAACRVPVLLVSGGRDLLCPDRFNSGRYSAQIPNARWIKLAKAGHFVFKPTCSLYGKLRAPGVCWDALGLSRARTHDEVSHEIVEHLREAMS